MWYCCSSSSSSSDVFYITINILAVPNSGLVLVIKRLVCGRTDLAGWVGWAEAWQQVLRGPSVSYCAGGGLVAAAVWPS